MAQRPTRPSIPESDLPILLQRHRDGTSLLDLSAEYGVTDEALRQRLDLYCISGKADVSWADAVTDYITARLVGHMQKQETSVDLLGNARARDNVKNWQWIAERRRPKLYGARQEMQVDHTVNITINRQPVILPVVDSPSIIAVNSEVIDKTKEDEH